MRRAGVLAILTVLVLGASAAGAAPGVPSFSVHASAAKGKVSGYVFSVTATPPKNVTLKGVVPRVKATASQFAKGTLVVWVVAPTGPTAWNVYLIVDASHTRASAGTIAGTLDLGPFLTGAPVKTTSPSKADCDRMKKGLSEANGRVNTVYAIGVLFGTTDAGHKIELDLDCP